VGNSLFCYQPQQPKRIFAVENLDRDGYSRF
jgi:hypothetical protein